MELKNKTINFLGDSITEGCKTSDSAHRFTDIIAREYELKEMRNYGIGGTRYAKQHTPSENPLHDLDFCSRVSEMAPDADIVVVFGGTNDYGHGDAPFGNTSDLSPDTFCGACNVLYSSLIAKYPDAKIVVVTPLHRTGENCIYGDGSKTVPCPPLEAYIKAICQVAADYGLPVLDLYRAGILNPNDPSVLAEFVPDGLHPNDKGHVILANEIGSFLSSL